MDLGTLDSGNSGIPLLPETPGEQNGEPSVDVAQLIRDIMLLPSDQINVRLALAGVDFQVLEGEDLPGYNETALPIREVGERVGNTLGVTHIYDFVGLFDRHIGYYHDLSPHARGPRALTEKFRQYLQHLNEVLPYVSQGCQDRIRKFSISGGISRDIFFLTLRQEGLLPEQIIRELEENGHESGGIPHNVILTYSGLNSYKQLFDFNLKSGVTVLPSQKGDVTNQELLEYIRAKFSHALDCVRQYLAAPVVRKFIQSEYGDNILGSISQDLKIIEDGFRQRIGSLPLDALNARDYVHFYQAYTTLMNRLFELEVIPQKISLVGLSEDSQ